MEIPRIAVAAPLDWEAPVNNFEGFYQQVSAIAAGNTDLHLFIIDVFRLTEDGVLPTFDLLDHKAADLPLNSFQLVHFLELEHYRDLSRPFHIKWAEVSQVLDRLERWDVPCVNSIDSVRYYMSKHYLFDLKAAGIQVMSTDLIAADTPLAAVKTKAKGRIVVKPLRGECGRHVHELAGISEEAYQTLAIQDEQYLLQPLHEEVLNGEVGLFYIGEQLAHAVLREPAGTDGEQQAAFPLKTTILAHELTSAEFAFGEQVRLALPVPLDFYRIDFIHTANGPLLMEIEAVDPFHYPQFNPQYTKGVGDLYRAKMQVPQLC